MTGSMPRDWRGIDRYHWRDVYYKHFLQINDIEYEALKDAIDRQLEIEGLFGLALNSAATKPKRENVIRELCRGNQAWITGSGFGDRRPADWEERREHCLKNLLHRRATNERRRKKNSIRGRPTLSTRQSDGGIIPQSPGASMDSPAEEDEPIKEPSPVAAGFPEEPQTLAAPPNGTHSRAMQPIWSPHQRERLFSAIITIENRVQPKPGKWFPASDLLVDMERRPDELTSDDIVFEKFAEEMESRGFDHQKHKVCWKAPQNRMLEIENDQHLKHALGVSLDLASEKFPYIDFVILNQNQSLFG